MYLLLLGDWSTRVFNMIGNTVFFVSLGVYSPVFSNPPQSNSIQLEHGIN